MLPDSFTLGLDRELQCSKPEEFDKFAEDDPLWGIGKTSLTATAHLHDRHAAARMTTPR